MNTNPTTGEAIADPHPDFIGRLTAMTAQAERDRLDAKRYRALRGQFVADMYVDGETYQGEPITEALFDAKTDELIGMFAQ